MHFTQAKRVFFEKKRLLDNLVYNIQTGLYNVLYIIDVTLDNIVYICYCRYTMNVKEAILKTAKEKRTFRTADVVDLLEGKKSRAWVSGMISNMVKEGVLVKSGVTLGSVYALEENMPALGNVIKKHLVREKIEEYVVLDDINHQAPFLMKLEENVKSLFDYAFSEMLNNAIEHSQSKFVDVEVGVDEKRLWFVVDDKGVGVFKNVMKKRGLKNEFEAMQDLLKGKTTTHPRAHSGEGIFFTSKVADVFVLESFGYSMRVDNTLPDIFFEQVPNKKGTRVTFAVDKHTQKHTQDVFRKYETDHDDPDFDKTEVLVRLYRIGTVYVSRSQARRILTGLEKFRQIVLDFDRVPTVGQAFADEIFRVFGQKYPKITIVPVNMNKAVKYMVERAGWVA